MPPASPSPQPQFVFAKTAHRYTQHHGSHEPPLVQEGPRPRRPTGATSDNAGPGRTARWRRRRGIAGHLPDDLDGQRCRANRRSRHRSRRQNSTGRSDRCGMPPTLRTGHPPIESGDPAPASSSETPQRPQITDSDARLPPHGWRIRSSSRQTLGRRSRPSGRVGNHRRNFGGDRFPFANKAPLPG